MRTVKNSGRSGVGYGGEGVGVTEVHVQYGQGPCMDRGIPNHTLCLEVVF